jgi:hypothetical protein
MDGSVAAGAKGKPRTFPYWKSRYDLQPREKEWDFRTRISEKYPPHPPLSHGIGGEDKGEGAI